MHCIDFFVILKFCVKQLTFFERTVVAASDFKNCTMFHCAARDHKFNKRTGLREQLNQVRLSLQNGGGEETVPILDKK